MSKQRLTVTSGGGSTEPEVKPKSIVILPAKDDSGQWHTGLVVEDRYGEKHYFIGRALKISEFEYAAGWEVIKKGREE